jgi:hypothetical protein
MPLDKKHIVNLKGKEYPVWAGVLAEAHKLGLRSITTELVQIPHPDNGDVAIVKARVELEDGRVFEDYGDCSPRSTTPMLVPASIRLASTRAKGRALRDATNIGEAMVDELAPEERDEQPAETRRASHREPPRAQADADQAFDKAVQTYEGLRAEYLSYFPSQAGMAPALTHRDTLAMIQGKGRAIWPAIVKERAARATLEAPPPAAASAPADKAGQAVVTKAQVFDGWQRIAAAADAYGLAYETLTPNASTERIQANGRALAETVQQVEADCALHRKLVGVLEEIGQTLPAGFEFTYDRVGDHNTLHAMVAEFAEYVEGLQKEAAGERPDPFEEEAA